MSFKKRNIKIVISIVLVIALTISLVGVSYKLESTPFSFGYIEDDEYYNDWTGMNIKLSNEWLEMPTEKYTAFDDDITTCDLYIQNNDGNRICILLMDFSNSDSTYSNRDLLQGISDGIYAGFSKPIRSNPHYKLIAGKLYTYVDTTDLYSENNICISTYVRVHGNYATIINITSDSAKTNHSIVRNIK